MSGWVQGYPTLDLQGGSGPRPPLLSGHVGEVKGVESRLGGRMPGAVRSLPRNGLSGWGLRRPLRAKKRVFCNIYSPWMCWESKMPGPWPELEP